MKEVLDRIPTFIPGSSLAYEFLDTILDGIERFPYALNELGDLSQEVPVSQVNDFNNEGKIAEVLRNKFTYYGSDKSHPHNYHFVYGEILNQLGINKALNILEIGLGTNNLDVPSNMGADGKPGASLRALRDVLPYSNIYGGDIDHRILFTDNRISTAWVDQMKPDSLNQLNQQFGNLQYDLIIDDGLHALATSLNTLLFGLKVLKPGGWLVIEDIWAGKVCWKTVYRLLSTSTYNKYILQSITGSWLFVVQKL